MKPGPKPQQPATKVARGTFQKCRDADTAQIIEPDALPMRPDWLTSAGEEVWMEDLGRVLANKLVTERDSTMFATYCNMQGAANLAWRAGTVPPTAHLNETRKMAEQFGIFGARSRIKVAQHGSPTGNPFSKNGSRG